MTTAAAAEPYAPEPVLPAYGGACVDGLVPALLNAASWPDWMPAELESARQVVLLVLDGLGWEQLTERARLAPTLTSMPGRAITTAAPSTTATALSTISLGMVPARHGVVGYRVAVAEDDVLNVLRWRTRAGDARSRVRPHVFQPEEAFCGARPPVVTRAEFIGSGFTLAHLGGARLRGWRVPSTMVVEVEALLRAGEPFVYAYYDGIDKVAHEKGLGPHFDAELAAVDRLVADIVSVLPEASALLVTSDHGQVHVGVPAIELDADVRSELTLMSGEGRFRWLHVRPGAAADLAAELAARYGEVAWVRTRDEVVSEGWLGGEVDAEVSSRLGDVALVAHAPVAFSDPADKGEITLVSRHGSLTSAEMLVPLLAGWG